MADMSVDPGWFPPPACARGAVRCCGFAHNTTYKMLEVVQCYIFASLRIHIRYRARAPASPVRRCGYWGTGVGGSPFASSSRIRLR